MIRGDATCLDSAIAVVTGGSRGIGEAVCERLASLGAMTIVNAFDSVSEAEAESVVQGIKSKGGEAETLRFDVSKAEEVDTAIKKVLDTHGRIDILINNAGISRDSLLIRTKDADWHKTLDVNLSGCFYCARAVAKPMMKAHRGRIVNISSVIGRSGNAGQVAYSASKAGIIGLTKSLAKELAGRGITVNAIAPGYIKTEMTDALDEKIKQEIMNNIPLNRLGTVEDVAQAVAFFCLPGSSYITGEVLGISGGLYI